MIALSAEIVLFKYETKYGNTRIRGFNREDIIEINKFDDKMRKYKKEFECAIYKLEKRIEVKK